MIGFIIMKSIQTPNPPAYHGSTLWPLEVWVRGLCNSWWFCVHKLCLFIYLWKVLRIKNTSSPRNYWSHFWSDKGFKGTVVNRTMCALEFWFIFIILVMRNVPCTLGTGNLIMRVNTVFTLFFTPKILNLSTVKFRGGGSN